MFSTPIIFANKISKFYNKNIWLKLEILNPTGSHKDRESIKMIIDAKKKKIRSIGCASTGNLGISLAYFANLYGMNCYIWLRKKDINTNTLKLIRSLGARVIIKKTSSLKDLYDLSSKIMFKKKIYNANPNNSTLKILANKNIVDEINKINKKVSIFASCINNGSHLLGLKKGLKKKQKLVGIFSTSKLAKSINSYSKYEYLNLIKKFNIDKDFIEAKEKNILKGVKLLLSEGLVSEPSSAAVVGSLDHSIFKKEKNICCIISGTAHKDLKGLQDLFHYTDF